MFDRCAFTREDDWLLFVQNRWREQRDGTGTILDWLPRPILRPRTWETYGDSLGYFQGWLKRQGVAVSALEDLCTEPLLLAYIAYMQERVAAGTRYTRVTNLGAALDVLLPGHDWSFVAQAAANLPREINLEKRLARIRDPMELIAMGKQLLVDAEHSRDPRLRIRAAQFRDGLILSGLASRSVRRENYAGLRMGIEFRQIGDDWWIVLDEKVTKNHDHSIMPWPHDLRDPLERYLSYWRPILAAPSLAERMAATPVSQDGWKEHEALRQPDWPLSIAPTWSGLQADLSAAPAACREWSEATWRINSVCLGSFLGWLASCGKLGPKTPIEVLITPENLAGFTSNLKGRPGSAAVRHYVVGVERACAALAPEAHDAYWRQIMTTGIDDDRLWLTYRGIPMSGRCLYLAVVRRTGINPHQFRVNQATEVADNDAANMETGADLLTQRRFATTEGYIFGNRGPAFKKYNAARAALRRPTGE